MTLRRATYSFIQIVVLHLFTDKSLPEQYCLSITPHETYLLRNCIYSNFIHINWSFYTINKTIPIETQRQIQNENMRFYMTIGNSERPATHNLTIYMLITYKIYIYIKWTVFVNVTTKSAQHAHARMIAIIVEKSTYDLSLDFFQQLYIYIYIYTVEPLYKGHPRWWPFKRGGLSQGVK